MKPADLAPGDRVRIFSPTSQHDWDATFVKSRGGVYFFEIIDYMGRTFGAGKDGLLSLTEANVRRYVRFTAPAMA
ncbi:MAG: hypothetical protein LBI92_07375 [Azoarcus sp.]|jgi:hypothetical protein|nr:hypothetical protein [Azoarcus sp.]